MGKIKWTQKATSHLHAIHQYIAEDSKTYADRFIKSLIQAAQKLEIMPRCGRIVPEFENFGFREILFRDYRIVYQIIEVTGEIEILAVVHGFREMDRAVDEELN